MGQGELFALTPNVAERLLTCASREEVKDLVTEIEETWEEGQRLPCGKQWPEIHQCLTGNKFNARGGPQLLNQCLLGSRHLLNPNGGYIAALLLPGEVPPVVAALDHLGEGWLRRTYPALFAEEWDSPIPDERLQELSDLFDEIRAFYRKAAAADRAALFTSDEILEQVYRGQQT